MEGEIMSQSFQIICRETKKYIWVGQGHEYVMSVFYSGNKETMDALKRFLNDHIDKPLFFIHEDIFVDEAGDYEEYE